ncbi:MAG TPA: hypothetical protein VFT66_18365 [Roseiflexaceae bacterium]|jgi:hypothetical protein|nr:hypothetical protein [Roseiflexaceae bacterium]
MSTEDFRADVRDLLTQFLEDAQSPAEREQLLQTYVNEFVALHGQYAHKLLNEVFADAQTRLDARMSPDPVRQTIATVQTTVQDVWKFFTNPFDDKGSR